MIIDITGDEAATMMVALDNYRARMENLWQNGQDPNARDFVADAARARQKIFTAQQQQFNNSVADAIGEGEQPNDEATASVDPYTLPTWTD